MTLSIRFPEGRTWFEPGERVELTLSWDRDEPIAEAELRLFWHTEGRGDSEGEMRQRYSFENLDAKGTHALEIELPTAPYSFSGKLVSLEWTMEFVERPSLDAARVPIVITPQKEEIRLHR